MAPRHLASTLLACLALVSVLACHQDNAVGPATTKELDSPSLLGATAGSANYIHVFASTGSFPYHCLYHSGAHYQEAGSVVVSDQGSDSAFVSIFEGAYHPNLVTVKPGAPVRWQNFDDGTHHTVTSD